MSLIVSGKRRDLRPNLTPRSLALAMPSICRSRRMSFSISAISARNLMTSLPVRELVSMDGSSITLNQARAEGALRGVSFESEAVSSGPHHIECSIADGVWRDTG